MFSEKTNRPYIHVEITLDIESRDRCLHGLS